MDRKIEELAEEWLRLDKDAHTRDEIYRLLQAGKKPELEDRLRNRIAFGTAGLRGRMEAGFSRFNALTVIQATQGLAAYLVSQHNDCKQKGVVIGRDARHNSERFAKLAAAVFVAKGIKVWWYEIEAHTPMVPFGVRELNAVAGVMITASHNPAQDNGYKVYWRNGCQIIPPHDTGIAAAILENLEPTTWDTSVVDNGNLLIEGALGLVRDGYAKAVVSTTLRDLPPQTDLSQTRSVYTPMHGVGLSYFRRVLHDLHIEANMIVVPQQAAPDPDFPTVKFPNPEEKGALKLAMQTADENDVTLVLATDPDADRLAVAEKVKGRWHQLSGNQMGILLASHIFETYPKDKDRSKLAMLASTVSSRMLAVMAKAEGFHYQETLTGFKWLGNEALNLQSSGYDVRFAFEEALGYMFPSVVHDKDGIAGCCIFLAAVARWKSQGITPYQKLQHLCRAYGHFEECNTYLISPSPTITNSIFEAIRKLGHPWLPGHPYVSHVSKRKVIRWRDLTVGYDSGSHLHHHKPELPVDKMAQMITVELDGDVRFTVRGSGTEPKIKLYIEARAGDSEEAREKAEEVFADLLEHWFKPEENGLKLA